MLFLHICYGAMNAEDRCISLKRSTITFFSQPSIQLPASYACA